MQNTRIRASAGAGKTFQLSNEFLQIVFEGKSVETILASTFTRKAAGEILDRILFRLSEAALDAKAYEELKKHVKPPTIQLVSHREGESPELRNLQSILADIARNLYRLRISTLDSFFNKIATTFSLELGLPPGWSILDEADFAQYVSEAVRNVLAVHENGSVELMHRLHQGENVRSVTRELTELASDHLPIIRSTERKHWDHADLRREELSPPILEREIERFATAELPKNKDKTVPKALVKTVEKIKGLAENGDWKAFLAETLIKSIVSGDNKYGTKEIDGELLDSAQVLIEQAKAVQLNKLAGQTLATRLLLEMVVREYDAILQREKRFRFEDITQRLGLVDFSANLDSLVHRMDAKTEFLLLDEFQDTSLPQWNILKPFAKEATKHGSVFCVGDSKQAIYGWRGGVAGIFDQIDETVGEMLERPLNKSYRSSPWIMKAVNRVFEKIDTNAALAVDENHAVAAKVWKGRFETHETAKSLAGSYRLEVAPAPQNDEEDAGEVMFQYIVDRIVQLHTGKPKAEIGVLVAKNNVIGDLIKALKEKGIEASEEGGNPLTDSFAVRHVLSAMRLADHPGDLIVRFHLVNGPLAEFLGLSDFKSDVQAVNAAANMRRRLLNTGYGNTVKELVDKLEPACNARELQRLDKLQELAFQYQEAVAGLRTERFVRLVETTKVESTTAAKIRVMTIHKSKGLEFDIVVLPDLDNDLVKQTPSIIVGKETPTAPVDFVVRYVGAEVQPLLPENFRTAFDKRVRSEVEESLSLLYVAMTRAKHELTMIVPPLSKSALKRWKDGDDYCTKTAAGTLRAALTPTNYDTENIGSDPHVLFEDGETDWYDKEAARGTWDRVPLDTATEIRDVPACSLKPLPKISYRGMKKVAPSGLEQESSKKTTPKIVSEIKSEPTEKRDRQNAMLWGTALHACFEHGLTDSPWLDVAEPNSQALVAMIDKAVAGKKGSVDVGKVLEAFQTACENPEIRAALSRKSYEKHAMQQHVDVIAERKFAVRLDDNSLLHGSVDRLVVFRDGKKAVGLDILDYKTDRPPAGTDETAFLNERIESYAPQLNAYREGMSKLYGIDPGRITARIVFTTIGRVVEV